MTELSVLTDAVADALVDLDSSGARFKTFQPGVGPFGEPQLVKQVAERLCQTLDHAGLASTKRTPDLLIRGDWAVEIKIARPFGDNGFLAENWSINLLRPYPGHVSSVGDCYKLRALDVPERKAVMVFGFEHQPAQVDLEALFKSFELVAQQVCGIALGTRAESTRSNLRHPIHQALRVVAWQVL